jgi:hypothetical protein
MASIERTAYHRFKRIPTAQTLHALYTPTEVMKNRLRRGNCCRRQHSQRNLRLENLLV